MEKQKNSNRAKELLVNFLKNPNREDLYRIYYGIYYSLIAERKIINFKQVKLPKHAISCIPGIDWEAKPESSFLFVSEDEMKGIPLWFLKIFFWLRKFAYQVPNTNHIWEKPDKNRPVKSLPSFTPWGKEWLCNREYCTKYGFNWLIVDLYKEELRDAKFYTWWPGWLLRIFKVLKWEI